MTLSVSARNCLVDWWRNFLGVPAGETLTTTTLATHPGVPNLGDWNGVYLLSNDCWTIVSVPDHLASKAKRMLADLHEPSFAEVLNRFSSLGNLIGPASIGYRDSTNRAQNSALRWRIIQADDPEMLEFKSECTSDEWEEAGLTDSHDLTIGVYDDDNLGALAGYERFEKQDSLIAQIGIIVRPSLRRRGLAEAATHLLVDHIVRRRLIPQYRAAGTNTASIRLLSKLGFERFAEQAAVRLRA